MSIPVGMSCLGVHNPKTGAGIVSVSLITPVVFFSGRESDAGKKMHKW
jgi:hypothetical protein